MCRFVFKGWVVVLLLPSLALAQEGESRIASATARGPAGESGVVAPADGQEASPEEAIRQMAADYAAAVGAGDFDGFLAFFTDDVIVYPPGEPAVEGKDALRAWSQPFFDRFHMEETISYEGLKLADDWGVGWYRYTFTTTPKEGGEGATEEGKGVVVLRRQEDGSWKWSLSAWNRNEPTPAEH